MIRLIAAIDIRRGLATDDGIPWRLPGDVAYFRERTATGAVLMGRATYEEFAAPLGDRPNYVATRSSDSLRSGFEAVNDLDTFLDGPARLDDLWVIGGTRVFAQTILTADEIYLTRVGGDFACTKFFPPHDHDFTRSHRSRPREENGIAYHFEIWGRPPPRTKEQGRADRAGR
jgi:dihydrofolate reductase